MREFEETFEGQALLKVGSCGPESVSWYVQWCQFAFTVGVFTKVQCTKP